MKLSRSRLKQIINEEFERVEEVKNDAVQLATLQAMAQGEAVNKSSDPEIIQQIQHAVTALEHLVSGLSDVSTKGTCMAPLNSFQNALDTVNFDVNSQSGVDDRPNATSTNWGENETPS
jgi:hypothetical protein